LLFYTVIVTALSSSICNSQVNILAQLTMTVQNSTQNWKFHSKRHIQWLGWKCEGVHRTVLAIHDHHSQQVTKWFWCFIEHTHWCETRVI